MTHTSPTESVLQSSSSIPSKDTGSLPCHSLSHKHTHHLVPPACQIVTDWLLPRRLGFVDVRNRTGTPDHRGHWEDWSLSLPLSVLIVHVCRSPASVLISFTSEDDFFGLRIQPPGVHFWVTVPASTTLLLLHRCWKPASMRWGSRGVLKIVALHLSAFVLPALPPILCLGSVEGINDLWWDLPSTVPTSCNTAFALVLSDVRSSSTVHPNQVFPDT